MKTFEIIEFLMNNIFYMNNINRAYVGEIGKHHKHLDLALDSFNRYVANDAYIRTHYYFHERNSEI